MDNVKVLITGADGNLGGKLTKLLADNTAYHVIAVSSFPDRLLLMLEREQVINRNKVTLMSSEEMFAADLKAYNICGAVHFAFSRAIFPNEAIANSLDYSMRAFKKIAESGIQNAIYVSSQSVYGDTSQWRVEDTIPAPNSIYAMAKYAGEKLFELTYWGCSELQHTIIRLDIVIQSQNLVKALCKTAKEKGVLKLKGGKQVFSYLDMSEVPNAILALLQSKNSWKLVYNVGHDHMRYTLLEVAQCVQKIALSNGYDVQINLQEDDTELWAGMNTRAFIQDTGWQPEKNLEHMVNDIFNSV